MREREALIDARPSVVCPSRAPAPVLLTPYAALQRLCAAGTLKLLMTDIVRREMDTHLAKKLETALD